jgi:hypothetical protein
VEGNSEAAGHSVPGQGGEVRLWDHEVRLAWEGWIEIDGNRIRRLELLARGSEKLRWGNGRTGMWGQTDVTHLLAGHAIDLAGGVKYGVIGEPAPADQVSADAPPPLADLPVGPVPEEARLQLLETLGSRFLIFRARVQEELNLSEEQKTKLDHRLAVTIQETRAFFQRVEGAKPEEREQALQSYRLRTGEKLATFLGETLTEAQQERLGQLALQYEGLFALGQPRLAKELQITPQQGGQFTALVQELQAKVQLLAKKAPSEGTPEQFRSKVMKLRKECEGRIEAILNDSQKERWKQMLGKRLELGD